MKKRIFITNGRPRSGKDTFAVMLQQYARVYKYSSINKIKEIASQCGWDGGKNEKDRKFLSDLKLLTTEYNDLAFEDLKSHVHWFMNFSNHEIMLIDIREPEEIKRACDEFGAQAIFIDNKNVKHISSNMADNNVENYAYDYVISNNGTFEDFDKNIEKFFNRINN